MRSQLFPDLLRRVLLAAGYDVTYVTNVTDVGHLVVRRRRGRRQDGAAAAATGQDGRPRSPRSTRSSGPRTGAGSGCLEPDLVPRAAAHIDEQIAMVRTLEEQGHTYVIDDGVYFDVSTFPRYADFAGLDLDELATSGRVEHVEAKRHPADFALWKLTPPGVQRQQEWDSPWGRGFPGWHIECSAMSTKYLGTNFDIHTGGVDHIRVHHTNEVAQSECVLGVHPWVQIWMHNEFLDLGGEKISKSKGHVLVVDTLVERGFDPMAFRYFFLQAHYRQQQAFTWEAIEAAANAHRRLVGHAVAAREAGGEPDLAASAPHLERFWSALADDLNAPRRWPRCGTPCATRSSRRPTCGRSSPTPTGPSASAWPTVEAPDADESGSDPRIDALVAEREAARAAKDFATSDRIRDELAAEGIELVDTPTGPTWRRGGPG